MKIIEYFTADNKEHWLREIGKCRWNAGKFLYELLSEDRLKKTVGETALVPMLVEGDKLISFCTFAPLDDIQPTELSPWIGFIYTFPEYRGQRLAGRLLEYSESLACIMGREYIYISTNHTGLYEKYGYEFYKTEKDISGGASRVYRKCLSADEAERNRMCEIGGKRKAQLVQKARQGADMTAYCGFSCNHCFMGEWCAGCRSVFSCCSYGTLCHMGKCPNIACCEDRGIEGCYRCPELETCTKGFFQRGNDGNAAKAHAVFIKKYGKEEHFNANDNLSKVYDFKKLQEILGADVEEGLKILEQYM